MDLKISLDGNIDADKLVTGRTCIIGQSGSGKSYTVAVLCEELAKNNIGFCIIDTEGEYASIKEKYPVLMISDSANSEVDLSTTSIAKVADTLLKKNFPAVFDVSEADNPKERTGELLNAFYKTATKLNASRVRIHYLLQKSDSNSDIIRACSLSTAACAIVFLLSL